MKIEYIGLEQLSAGELQQLEKLKTTIEAAIANGRLTYDEMQRIKAIIFANKKLYSGGLDLYQTLVIEKIERGELEYEWQAPADK